VWGARPVLALPPELAERHTERFELDVGPPSARMVSWLIEPSSTPRGTIVLLHGVRSDRRSLAAMGIAIADAGYRSVLVDLRGHGESTGQYLTYGAVEAGDVSSLLDAVGQRGELGCVGAYGFSYGAAVALQLSARDHRLKAVVAVAPFASLREVVLDYRERYLPYPLRLLPDLWFEEALNQASQLALFDPERSAPLHAVSRSHAHQLLIHGTADTQVPLKHSQELALAAGPGAELMTVNGASHENLPFETLSRAALAWYEKWLTGPACAQP
jgi:pimeloyl-ACP methyl ester carboxylesterase